MFHYCHAHFHIAYAHTCRFDCTGRGRIAQRGKATCADRANRRLRLRAAEELQPHREVHVVAEAGPHHGR